MTPRARKARAPALVRGTEHYAVALLQVQGFLPHRPAALDEILFRGTEVPDAAARSTCCGHRHC
jgi:hypothetical protein